MCGIAGIAGMGDAKAIRRMADTIVHRGPDGEGYFVGAGISLAARRLSIIDLPGSDQPIWNEDRTVVTVFNGEIYNYRELRAMLETKGHVLRTAGDTEVLVHLYEEYGEAGVHLLRGMFAYAIWDARRRRLLLARDRLGIKPLYYAESHGRLVFASELKAILAAGDVRRDVDEEALDLYLTLQYVPGPRTMVRGIRKLLPGHLLVWHAGETRVTRYWDVVLLEGDRNVTEESAAEEFQSLLEETTRLHRISDVPIGVLLSGGIDSSTVTGLLARGGDRPKTFTVGFQAAEDVNEIEEARLVAGHFNTDHHEMLMGSSVADVLPRIVWFQDEPVADPAAIPTYFICQFASKSVKVVLTGEGGDEILGGYPRYWWLDMSERVHAYRLGRWAEAGMRTALAARLPETRVVHRLRTLVGTAPLGDRHLEWVSNMDGRLQRELRNGAVATGDTPRGASVLIDDLLHRGALESTVASLMYIDFKTWLPDNILMKIDRMSMAASVEARVPFLDHRLVEFVATLPHRLKVRNFGTKRLLRHTMKPILPAQTLRRRKTAFRVPLDSWLAGELRDLLTDTLTSARARTRGFFHPRVVDRLLTEQRGGGRESTRPLFNLLWLELWLRQFADAPPPAHH